MTETRSAKNAARFWHPPLWKWGVVLLLAAFAVFLIFRKPSHHAVKVELLPFTDSPPPWDGSLLYLVISPINHGSEAVKFDSSFLLIKPTARHDSPINEFQVNLATGMFLLRQTDLFIPDAIPLSLTRTYVVWDFYSRALGVGTNHPYDICPTGTRFPYTYMDLNLEDDFPIYFPRISKGTGYADAVYRHSQTSSEFYGAQIAWNGDGWTLNFRDGRRFLFHEAYYAKNYAQGAPIEMLDAKGHRLQLRRDKQRNLEQLISPSGHTITFRYDAEDRITEATDDAGKVRKYFYGAGGHLETVANAAHPLYRFEYACTLRSPGYDPCLMTSIADGSWNVLLRNTYNNRGMIAEQRLANGDVYTYSYVLNQKNVIAETIVGLPTGKKRKFFFEHGVVAKEE